MPTVTSATEICNIALTRLGHEQITSFPAVSGDGKAGRLCNLHYVPTRDAVLRAHPWNFAIKRATLAQDGSFTADDLDEYTYSYPLPEDYLKLIRTDLDALNYVDVDYRIEHGTNGSVMRSNEGSVFIEYIARIEDVARYDSLFVDLLAQRLAAEMAIAFTDTQTAAKGMWEVYDLKLREARGVDSQEGIPRDIQANQWLYSRA
jgi:hypothetical protein